MTKPTCEDTFLKKRRSLGNDYYSLTFSPYSQAERCRPGHFVHLKLPGNDVFFRRAFSIAAVSPSAGEMEIIFKIVGRGTRAMAHLRPGDPINLLGPLGTPFKRPRKREHTLMVAGGIGFPPLLFLARDMISRGHDPKRIEFFYGGRTAGDVIERSRIKKLGVTFRPVTEDGSLGSKGLVTVPVEEFIENHDNGNCRIYGCGPEGMLKSTNELALRLGVPGQISLEAPMPCGIGVCLGCVVPLTDGGHARVCCDGPVFSIGEVAL
ncbi:MAG: dihydroorotate dehydrogenase electron transfer subunit [candidate division Zixibacteria bacterium]|nr:dihydroorotate dehydrogenase electron transfer subunit [candidate division Zixibacteria bacterium]